VTSTDPIAIEIATPGVQVLNRTQLVALSELQSELRSAGLDVALPPENRAWIPSPDDVLHLVELYIGSRPVTRLLDKVLDDAVDAAYGTAKSWAKRTFAKFRRDNVHNDPPDTLRVIIYGPDGLPLRTIDVPDEYDEEQPEH
jgi:hypothetical protein